MLLNTPSTFCGMASWRVYNLSISAMGLVMEESSRVSLIIGTQGLWEVKFSLRIVHDKYLLLWCWILFAQIGWRKRVQDNVQEVRAMNSGGFGPLMVCERDYQDHISQREAIQTPNILVFTSRIFRLYCEGVWTHPQSKYTIVCVLLYWRLSKSISNP